MGSVTRNITQEGHNQKMKFLNTLIIFSLTTMCGSSAAFEFTLQPKKRLVVNEGGSITLMYKVSAYWEHCIFSVLSSDGSSDNGKRTVCDLEWKRSQWNVTKNCCDPRATFVGSYNQFECGITLTDVTPEE